MTEMPLPLVVAAAVTIMLVEILLRIRWNRKAIGKILACLERSGPMYTLQIARAVNRPIRFSAWIYPVLHGMEARGLVHSWDGDDELAPRGGFPRHYYALTPAGRERLLADEGRSVKRCA